MNAIVLPLVQKIDGPDEYPYARASAKMQVGEQWYIVVGHQSTWLMPELLDTNVTELAGTTMTTTHRFYRCVRCKVLFLAYDDEGYIHECCEVE